MKKAFTGGPYCIVAGGVWLTHLFQVLALVRTLQYECHKLPVTSRDDIRFSIRILG